MSFHYNEVDYSRFGTDLLAKDKVILIYREEKIVGFSTLKIFNFQWKGKVVRILFSGDTIVDFRSWGQLALFKGFGTLLANYLQDTTPLYWLLISKGFRTYLILPTFFYKFVPSPGKVNKELIDLRDSIGRYMWQEKYDDDTGIYYARKDRLKEEFASIPEKYKNNKYVNFFLKANPTYYLGDELVCVAPITTQNLKLTGKKFVKL